MASTDRIMLFAERCWVIRSPSKLKPGRYQYHCYQQHWNHLPTVATIYRAEDIANGLIRALRDANIPGFSISDQVETVPLEGALRTCGIAVVKKES